MTTMTTLQEQLEYINYRASIETDSDRRDRLSDDYDRVAQQIIARALTVCVIALGSNDAA